MTILYEKNNFGEIIQECRALISSGEFNIGPILIKYGKTEGPFFDYYLRASEHNVIYNLYLSGYPATSNNGMTGSFISNSTFVGCIFDNFYRVEEFKKRNKFIDCIFL